MKLIDADKLNARISRDGTPYFTVCDIENAPTVDAVPVIRCENCIYSRECNKSEKQWVDPNALICINPNFTEDGWNIVWPHDFCPYGESIVYGKWILHGKHNDVFECSNCHEEIWDEQTPYCPYCGAKMNGR